jgi:ribosomal protein S18 acetylase RimI-like enzyme
LKISILTSDAAQEYRRLRLEGLAESPLSFRSSPEDESSRSLQEIAAGLEPARNGSRCVFGTHFNGILVGILSFHRDTRAKVSHAVELTGMYVDPGFRRKGVGKALLAFAIEYANALADVQYLRLVVNASNDSARCLYISFGFECCGIEPRAVFVDDRYYDEELYVLKLTSRSRA